MQILTANLKLIFFFSTHLLVAFYQLPIKFLTKELELLNAASQLDICAVFLFHKNANFEVEALTSAFFKIYQLVNF